MRTADRALAQSAEQIAQLQAASRGTVEAPPFAPQQWGSPAAPLRSYTRVVPGTPPATTGVDAGGAQYSDLRRKLGEADARLRANKARFHEVQFALESAVSSLGGSPARPTGAALTLDSLAGPPRAAAISAAAEPRLAQAAPAAAVSDPLAAEVAGLKALVGQQDALLRDALNAIALLTRRVGALEAAAAQRPAGV